jgi:uncharacterized heparinase superfamily protein
VSLAQYFETVRHLRPGQWTGRLKQKLPRPSLRSGLSTARRLQAKAWKAPAPRPASLLSPTRVRLLNVERDISSPHIWNDRSASRLWLYHLHYFDETTPALIARWTLENPGTRGVGWEPYPIARRTVNWIKWALSGGELAGRALESLTEQTAHLESRLETHLLGNHLLADAKALLIAGSFFVGPQAERWRRSGERLLRREWDEQILPDGGHYERSPMYHALALEDALDVVNLCRTYGWVDLERRARKAAADMLGFLPAAMHPDGELAFFNDTAIGVAPRPQALFDYAERLGLRAPHGPGRHSEARPEFGLWAISGGDTRLIFDAGRIGPDHQPGHAHCDTLSYELSAAGRRVVVNSGVYAYTGPGRQAFRRTRAHNTVELDGQEQHEIWADFRVARRGAPTAVKWNAAALSAAHTGYTRLSGRPLHRRSVVWNGVYWSVSDRVEASGAHEALSSVHLHPDARVLHADAERVVCEIPGRRVVFTSLGAPWTVSDAEYSPEFGLTFPTRVLRQRIAARGNMAFGHLIGVEPT